MKWINATVILMAAHPRFLPTVGMCLSFLTGLIYLLAGDYKRTLYWWSAVPLTWSITY
jgi:hypothetical protein